MPLPASDHIRTTGRTPAGAQLYKGGMRTRLAAWLLTGPLGHLAAGALDWGALLARWARNAR